MNTNGPIRDTDLDMRSVRAFVAVADELSFTRAAERLFTAQQAISRTIRQLEERLGTPLLLRTTRQVTLTPEGRRFLVKARQLVALHDEIVGDLEAPRRPIVIDLLSEGRQTGPRILDAIRSAAPELEFRATYGGGVGAAVRRLQAGDADVALGRAQWIGGGLPAGVEHRLIRFEPLALMLPDAHPLADLETVPIGALAGAEIDVNPAHPEAPEWVDLSGQLLSLAGAVATPPHLPAVGSENQADHLTRQGLPILTSADHVAVPGGVVRPLVDPIPIFPWSLIWRRELNRSVARVVVAAAARLADEQGWLMRPEGAWLPDPEASQDRP